MWMLVGFMLVACVTAGVVPNGDRSYSIYETPENIMANGYPAERHHVTTEDGYILEMHRIPRGRSPDGSTNRPVVFLMHGLLSASNSFIAIGPNSGVAYNFADAGFDVWMGNARGNKNSRSHTSLDPDNVTEKYQFFNFSFEEIGTIDIPSMVDYILSFTGKDQLHYIGHSQGGTVFLVLTSMRPEYNAKIKSAHLLAGVGYQNYCPNTELVDLAAFTDFIYNFALAQGLVELYPPNEETGDSTRIAANPLCSGNADHMQVCQMLGLSHVIRAANDTAPVNEIGGAALKQIAHYGQNIRDKVFRRWNYGFSNSAIYGQSDPPAYDLGLITANVTMHYTLGDNLLDERDVLAMAADMPHTTVRKVPKDTFEHSDFVLSEDSKELVTDYIITTMLCVENPETCASSASSIFVSTLLKLCLITYVFRIM